MLDAREKARLAQHCRRGMLELDLILQRFLQQGLNQLSTQELKAFDALLNCPDPELYAWLMGYEDPEDEELKGIVTILRA